MVRAVALDLGSTRFKAAVLEEDGSLANVRRRPAPPLTGIDPIHEGRATDYLRSAEGLLKEVTEGLPDDVPIGLTSQRSTCLLWDKTTGAALTPVISWQDRRAHAWCRHRASDNAWVSERTGLLLSPHYAGPKLACLLESDPGLRSQVEGGTCLFGTLESYLVWNWSGGVAFDTDLSMAARTLLADPVAGTWAPDLLSFFGVPDAVLPTIAPSAARSSPLPGLGTLTASLADQSASALAVLEPDAGDLLVNAGTGVFVLRPTRTDFRRSPGYLTSTLCAGPGPAEYAMEGTINGGGSALDPYGSRGQPLPDKDPTPEAFCLPDATGVGAPYWRSDVPFTMTPNVKELSADAQRRTVLEGIVFRIRQVVEGVSGAEEAGRVIMTGGLASEPALVEGVASCLGRPMYVLEEQEATLLGVARMAAARSAFSGAPCRTVEPGARGAYLAEKYGRWCEWLAGWLG